MHLNEIQLNDRLRILEILAYFLVGGLFLWSSHRPLDYYRFVAMPWETIRLGIPDIYSERARQEITISLTDAAKHPTSELERTAAEDP